MGNEFISERQKTHAQKPLSLFLHLYHIPQLGRGISLIQVQLVSTYYRSRIERPAISWIADLLRAYITEKEIKKKWKQNKTKDECILKVLMEGDAQCWKNSESFYEGGSLWDGF